MQIFRLLRDDMPGGAAYQVEFNHHTDQTVKLVI